MNDNKPNAVKVTLDDGRSFIIETTSTRVALAKLRNFGKISAEGCEVAFTAKVHHDFNTEVV